MSTIAAIVITYHPGQDLYENIQSYLQLTGHLYIADNSVPGHSFPAAITQHPKVTLISDNKNEGIALRLNQAADDALKKGYKWLLTMDQDSRFDPDNLSAYLEYAQGYDNRQHVAMFGVETSHPPELIADLSEPADQLITSGSLVNLELYTRLGPFDEGLFIDEVDHEYCYRAQSQGYKIIQFTHIYLSHQLGTTEQIKTLQGQRRATSFHAPVRLYYMVRNFLYVRSKYRKVPGFERIFRYRTTDLLHRIKNNVLYGHHRLTTLKMIFSALIDYAGSKMGKRPVGSTK